MLARIAFLFIALLAVATTLGAHPIEPITGQAKLPHIEIDGVKKQVRVECQALRVDIPLEFFCVLAGGNEHESVLRTQAKPSDIHTALLMLGLKPGGSVRYSQEDNKWIPPHGPPLHIYCDYVLNGKPVHVPANRMMRDDKTKKEAPPFTWVFCGSRVMDDGTYAADVTSYAVSVVNFEYTLIDVPQLASNANETLEWEDNPDMLPAKGTAVTMTIEPAEADTEAPEKGAASQASEAPPVAAATQPGEAVDNTLVTIGADGTIELNHKAVAIDSLTAKLVEAKTRGPVKVVIAPDPASPREIVDKVVVAVAAAEVPLDVRPAPSTRPGSGKGD